MLINMAKAHRRRADEPNNSSTSRATERPDEKSRFLTEEIFFRARPATAPSVQIDTQESDVSIATDSEEESPEVSSNFIYQCEHDFLQPRLKIALISEK